MTFIFSIYLQAIVASVQFFLVVLTKKNKKKTLKSGNRSHGLVTVSKMRLRLLVSCDLTNPQKFDLPVNINPRPTLISDDKFQTRVFQVLHGKNRENLRGHEAIYPEDCPCLCKTH